ncbi:MAG: lytic transglycosylase domain-containing protein [bacterium]
MMTWGRRILVMIGLMALLGLGVYWAFRFEIQYYRYRAPIDLAAARYDVPPRLIAAVIWQETRFNPACHGKAGEAGLMQIMPQSAGEWARSEHLANFDAGSLYDPGTNILAGTWYLGRAMKRWSGHEPLLPCALAEYNAGRSNSLRWHRNAEHNPEQFTDLIDYPGTRSYIRNILNHYDTFGRPWRRW